MMNHDSLTDKIKYRIGFNVCTKLKVSQTIRSDEGLALEMSAPESLYGGQFTLSTQLIKPNYLKSQSPHLNRLSFRCDCILGTPPMFIDILAHPDLKKYDLSSLRKGNGFCNLEASFPETLGRRLLNLALG